MAIHKGSGGIVKIGGFNSYVIAEVKSWSIEQSSDTIEDTTMGSNARTYKPGNTNHSGSIEAFWDDTDKNGQGVLVAGAKIQIKIYPDGDREGDIEVKFNSIVTSISKSASFDGMVEASFSFQGSRNLYEGPYAPIFF